MDDATRLCIDYAIRSFASRLLQNPNLDDHPAPVICNERDKFLDEISRLSFVERIKSQSQIVNGDGHEKVSKKAHRH